jgi:hypothetical protein
MREARGACPLIAASLPRRSARSEINLASHLFRFLLRKTLGSVAIHFARPAFSTPPALRRGSTLLRGRTVRPAPREPNRLISWPPSLIRVSGTDTPSYARNLVAGRHRVDPVMHTDRKSGRSLSSGAPRKHGLIMYVRSGSVRESVCQYAYSKREGS